MEINKDKFYSWLYDWHFLIIFFLFIIPLIITGITQNPLYIIIGWSIEFIFLLFSIFYLYVSFDNIKFWWKSLFKYKLTKEEQLIWNSIVVKEALGYSEWYEKTKGDDMCGPWIKDITHEEVALIDKIHEKFYGKNWWIACPISTAQVCSVKYDNIKDKVIYGRN